MATRVLTGIKFFEEFLKVTPGSFLRRFVKMRSIVSEMLEIKVNGWTHGLRVHDGHKAMTKGRWPWAAGATTNEILLPQVFVHAGLHRKSILIRAHHVCVGPGSPGRGLLFKSHSFKQGRSGREVSQSAQTGCSTTNYSNSLGHFVFSGLSLSCWS